jgi:hypothetical protein
MRLLYGDKASLVVENMNENVVCATVKIPLISTVKILDMKTLVIDDSRLARNELKGYLPSLIMFK